jgi:hypothetical protein
MCLSAIGAERKYIVNQYPVVLWTSLSIDSGERGVVNVSGCMQLSLHAI